MSKRVLVSSLSQSQPWGLRRCPCRARVKAHRRSSSPPTTVARRFRTVPKTPWGDPDLQGVWAVTSGIRAARRISAATSISVMKHSLLA